MIAIKIQNKYIKCAYSARSQQVTSCFVMKGIQSVYLRAAASKCINHDLPLFLLYSSLKEL